MKIALCDDTLTDLHQIESILEHYGAKHPDLTLCVSAFSNPDDFLQAYALNPNYDLIFLDMVMPFLSGLSVAKAIRKIDEQVKIVFLTISPEFALDAYEVKAYHYLIKPIQHSSLFKILDEVRLWIKAHHRSHLVIRERESTHILTMAKIAYVEVVKHRLFYHLMDKSTLTSVSSLKEISEVLSKEAHFIRVHKSFIVNLYAIYALHQQSIIMNDQTIIPISRTRTKLVRQQVLHFLIQHGKTT